MKSRFDGILTEYVFGSGNRDVWRYKATSLAARREAAPVVEAKDEGATATSATTSRRPFE